jgi:hypothetical protein
LAGRARAEVLAEFIERGTEPGGTGERTEAAQRIVALFDRTMVLLQPIVEILTGPMHDLAAYAATDGAWIGIVAIGRHPLRRVPDRLDRLFEEGFGGDKIAGRAEHRVHQIPFAVNGPIQVMPASTDFDVRFVELPGLARLTMAPGFELPAQQRREAFLPLPHRLMGEFVAPHQEHLGQVA